MNLYLISSIDRLFCQENIMKTEKSSNVLFCPTDSKIQRYLFLLHYEDKEKQQIVTF